jgi:hypothetical protein
MLTIVRAKTADVETARETMLEMHERKAFDHDAMVNFLCDPANYLFLALEDRRVAGSLFGYSLVHPPMREPQFLLYDIDVRAQSRRRPSAKLW